MYKVLVVDDEPLIVKAVCNTIVENFDVEIYRATSGFEAMTLLREIRFDLVVTDVIMPMMNGLELLDYIKQRWPRCSVIVLSAHENFEYVYQSIHYHNVDYVLKVDGFSALRQKVEKAFERLEKERRKEEIIISMGKRINEIQPTLHAEIINRLLLKQEPLAEANELEVVRFPLLRDKAVMLICMMLDSDRSVDLNAIAAETAVLLQQQFATQGMKVLTHRIGCYWLWFIQGARDEKEDLAFIRETLEGLFAHDTEEHEMRMTFAMADVFADWDQMAQMYACMVYNLERARGNSGVLMISEAQMVHQDGQLGVLSFDILDNLWEELRQGKKTVFLNTLSRVLSPLCGIADVTAALPLQAVSAVSYLYLNVCHLYGLEQLLTPQNCNLLKASGHINGLDWHDGVLRMFEEALDHKSDSYQQGIAWLVTKVKEYVNQHLSEDVHLNAIADVFHYSPAYLSRVFKSQTGYNLSTYINEQRVEYAKAQLTETALPAQTIAANAGFYSTKYFTQVFKKTVGETPREYRAKMVEILSQQTKG